MHAVLQMRRLGIRPLELVGRVRHFRQHVRSVRVCAAAAEQVPAAVELTANRLEPAMSRFVEPPLLRIGPETVLFIHEGVDAV